MSEHALDRILQEIEPLNIDARVQAQARLDVLTKPPGSLGRLEDLAVQYVSITGNVSPSLPYPPHTQKPQHDAQER